MRLVSAFYIAILVAAAHIMADTKALAQSLDKRDIEFIIKASEAERAYLLKAAENRLTETAEKMFSDPANQDDGFVWVRKVIAASYFTLSKDAAELQMPELAGFYISKAALLGKNVRGEITAKDFAKEERKIEASKQSYLESLIREAPKTPSIPISELTERALAMASKIHGMAVIQNF